MAAPSLSSRSRFRNPPGVWHQRNAHFGNFPRLPEGVKLGVNSRRRPDNFPWPRATAYLILFQRLHHIHPTGATIWRPPFSAFWAFPVEASQNSGCQLPLAPGVNLSHPVSRIHADLQRFPEAKRATLARCQGLLQSTQLYECSQCVAVWMRFV